MAIQSKTYDSDEEFWNVLTHGFGLLLSIIATILLVKSSLKLTNWHVLSFSIYGASLILLYFASTIYHLAKKPDLRLKLNVFDHSAIYVLIAGTYTPFLLVTLRGPWGWSLLAVIWGMALIGIILKQFFTGRYDKISTLAYVIMGFTMVVAANPLSKALAYQGIVWMVIGCLLYAIGAVFYLRNSLKFNHAIFHVFVLLGSFSHFVSVYYYV